MPVVELERRLVAKPWGRSDLTSRFGLAPGGEPIGEIWFADVSGDTAELLIKYLFTSEKLSIQVHPDDAAAQATGYPRGKDEAWVVVEALPDAVIGLGLVETISREELREAAIDGSIEQLIDWRHVTTGDVLYSPAGTIHALGAGLALVEVQQNLDLTYRLYDYGRPRELHVDAAVAVAELGPYRAINGPKLISEGRELLAAGAFVVERWRDYSQEIGADSDAPIWMIPLAARSFADDVPMLAGSVWVARGSTKVRSPRHGPLLIAYAGSEVRCARKSG